MRRITRVPIIARSLSGLAPSLLILGLALVAIHLSVHFARAEADEDVAQAVTRRIVTILPADGAAGVTVATLSGGRPLFFNFGWADVEAKRPPTPDSLFNLASLRKVFETTLLAQAVLRGELALDDPVDKYVVELKAGGDIRRVTLGQLATHTSGLLLPQDHPPWPDWGYSLPEFIATMNAWRADTDHTPGRQHIYTHAGFILLALAIERGLGAPIDELIERRILRPLGMPSTSLPRRDDSPRGHLSPEHKLRAVQGYGDDGQRAGEPGDQGGYYHWPGTSQMYSSARDLATFLAANLGNGTVERSLRDALALARRGVLTVEPHTQQGLAWEIIDGDAPTIVEKYGGLHNASAYIGMMPGRNIGVVILGNRGNLYPAEAGRGIMLDLVRMKNR
jgi:beta-lactamase class C